MGKPEGVFWFCTSQAVLTAAVEAGCSRALFKEDTLHLAQSWQQLATFQALSLQQDGSILDQQENKVSAAGATSAVQASLTSEQHSVETPCKWQAPYLLG